ncbi:hypothetical protein MetMK1DRAFT_00015380 [Metallosphaera yellowstonensis MK1]|uniref:Uncharacterized protein n=1 Tax=Metallosphaera yellowstonensis MK1 TaxID=671065 RepID=H2C4L6_9CREN|nr:hypothetical protein MetMK1DRAFT_00015380 [Metallosphaera yellowstonensis MK1]
MIGREVVVEGYGPGDPGGGVALAELSRRELKDSARLFDLRRDLPGGKEVGEEGRATGGDGLGEGFACKPTIGTTTGATGGDGLGEGEEVQRVPNPPVHPPFEVDQAGLPRDLDPGAGDCRV